jgi:hypothetical protein
VALLPRHAPVLPTRGPDPPGHLADLTAYGPYAKVFLNPLARDPAQPTWPRGTPRFVDARTDLFGATPGGRASTAVACGVRELDRSR